MGNKVTYGVGFIWAEPDSAVLVGIIVLGYDGPPVGTILGRYDEIEREAGQGNLGTVTSP
jgi:hypothetical protein